MNAGGHIWWNEGTSTGFVQTIVEGLDAEAAWGFDEPRILVSGYQLGSPTIPDTLLIPPRTFK